MRYECLKCGHRWERDITATYLQCPKCRSRDVVPFGFWKWVEEARKLGINPHTPILDLLTAAKVVWGEKGIFELGCKEFIRVTKRLIKAVENEE